MVKMEDKAMCIYELEQQLQYLREHHQEIIVRMIDSFMYFMNASLRILRSAGHFGMILPDVMLYQSDTEKLRQLLVDHQTLLCVANLGNVFEQVIRPACVVAFVKSPPNTNLVLVTDLTEENGEAKAKCLFDGSKFQRVSQNDISAQ